MRQELASLLSSVQLLREDNPGRKIAEIQGKLATVPPEPCARHVRWRGPQGGPRSETP